MVHRGGKSEIGIGVLAELVGELLDAHCDTVCLAGDHDDESEWCRHLDYLRDLQRAGHEVLARLEFAPSD